MIRLALKIYIIVLIADAVLSFFPQFRHNPWAKNIKKAVDFSCKPIRKFMPPDLPFDISPMIVIILIQLVMALW